MQTQTINLRRGAFGQPSVPFLLSRRAHLLTTCEAGGGIPPAGQARALFTNCLSASSPEGAGNAAGWHSLCSRHFCLCRDWCLPHQSGRCSARLLPAKTCHWQLYRSYGRLAPPIFFLRKRNKNQERKDNENKWRSIIWKQRL